MVVSSHCCPAAFYDHRSQQVWSEMGTRCTLVRSMEVLEGAGDLTKQDNLFFHGMPEASVSDCISSDYRRCTCVPNMCSPDVPPYAHTLENSTRLQCPSLADHSLPTLVLRPFQCGLGRTSVSPISHSTNLPSSLSSPASHSPDIPRSLLLLPRSTLVPLVSSPSQNVPQCIPRLRSLLSTRCISSASPGEQWRDEVRVYWSSDRLRRLRRTGREEPVATGRREREKGE